MFFLTTLYRCIIFNNYFFSLGFVENEIIALCFYLLILLVTNPSETYQRLSQEMVGLVNLISAAAQSVLGSSG